MNIKQKNKRPLLYLGVAIFVLFVVSVYTIYPFQLVNGDEPPPLPSSEMITMHYHPTLQSIPSPDADGTLYLRWNSIENALAYQVYYKKSSGNWISKLTLDTTYWLRNLGEGDYSIMVRGYDNIGYSDWSPIEYITVEFPEEQPPPPPPDAPELNSISPSLDEDGEVYLSWNAITGAVSYQIYMSKDGGSWDNIATISTIYYTTDALTDGNYRFKVISYNSVDYSADSNVESVVVAIPTAPNKPILIAITPALSDDGIIRLDWDAVDNANKYALYRAKDGGELVPLIQNSTQIYYDDVIEFDGNYSYQVKAGNDVGYSDFSNERTVVVQLIVPDSPIMNELTYTTISGITRIQLSWSEVDCDSYNVYKKIGAGDYILIGENLALTIYSEDLTGVGVYFYRVSAVLGNKESEMSDFTSIGITEDREPIVRDHEEIEEPLTEPTDYTMTYILVVLGVLAVPVVLILVKRKKR